MTRTGWVTATLAAAGLWMGAAAGCAAGGEPVQSSGDDDGAGASGGAGGQGGGQGGQAMGGAPVGGGGGSGGEAPSCEEEPCKLTAPQCGCPSGEQCSVFGETITCTAEGDVGPGEACGTCTPGYLCVNNLTGGAPICHEFCDDDTDCSAPGGLCVLSIGEGLTNLCSQNCDPVSDTGCEVDTMKCDIAQEADGDMRWFTRCTGSGSVGQGEICTNGNQCAKGLGCFGVQGMDDQLCLTWCKVASASCPADSQCASFTTPILIGSIEYGACVPMQ